MAAGARMIVVADVAENYLEARGLQRRIAVLNRGIAAIKELLGYVEARAQAGQALPYDVNLVRERLNAQQAKRPPLVALFESRHHRLATLTGLVPETPWKLTVLHRTYIPPMPTGLLPSQVLDRRPDVRARSHLVEAAAAHLDSVKTDVLPRFGIQFLGGDGRLHFNGLPGFGATGSLLDITAGVPVFTAGRIQANIVMNDARLHAAVAEYDKTMLHALEDVENAYSFRVAMAKRRALLTDALIAAQANKEAATGLYEGGRKTMQDVLDARLKALEDEDELVQAEMGEAIAAVQLYRALGGGWS